MKDSKVAFRLIDFILLNLAIVAVIAVIVFTNVNNMHKEGSEGPSISKEIIQGSISIFDYEETRLSVIKVGENYYCRNVPLSSIPLDEEVTE